MANHIPKALINAFGKTEEGEPNLPPKMGSVRIARIVRLKSECSYCFPHGMETSNATEKKNRRSWKQKRKTKFRVAT